MNNVLTVLIFLILFSVLVLVHELGHFFAAKKLGVVSEEFGLGLPPKITKLFTWRGTEFTLNWLPIGGFVRMRGEDPTSSRDAGFRGEDLEKDGYFFAQKPWKRAIVLVAGATMNALLAVFAFTIVYSALGIPRVGTDVRVDAVIAESPAQQALVQTGDIVRKVKVLDASTLDFLEPIPITQTIQFVDLVNAHRGEDVGLILERNGALVEVKLRPRLESQTPEGQGAIGVAVSAITFVHYPFWQMPFRASVVGAQEAMGWGRTIIAGLGTMLRQLILEGKIPSDIAGPIGIAKLTGKVAAAGWIPFAQFAGILSVNLAIVNLLPIPALDGGRLLFLGVEVLRRKPMNPKNERLLHLAGYVILLSLLFLITVKDITGF